MASTNPSTDRRWWHRRQPSLIVFAVVMAVLALTALAMAQRVIDVLPEVPRDQLGDDRWTEPLGVSQAGDFQLAIVPKCAAGPITRIALWDADSKPYWEVAGPARPIDQFFVGLVPEGFTELVPYREPPPGAILRLVAFRTVGGAAGIRYTSDALRPNRVVSGTPLTSFTIDGFKDALVCSDSVSPTGSTEDGGVPATSVPGAPAPTSVPG